MVGFAASDGRSRAQLVLVGALAIAFMILGIVVVFNTVLFTENVDSTGSVSAVDDSEELRHASAETAVVISRTLNEDNQTVTDLRSNMATNVSDYNTLLRETYSEQGPRLVNVSYNHSESQVGARVFQDGVNNFQNDLDDNWALATDSSDSDPADVARFEMNTTLDSLNSDDWEDSFHIAVQGRDGTDMKWRVIRFYESGDDLIVNTSTVTDSSVSTPGGYSWHDEIRNANTVTCEVSSTDAFTINVTNGSVQGDDCSFEFTDDIEHLSSGGYELWMRDSENVTGNFSLYLSNVSSVENNLDEFTVIDTDPDYSPIVWRAGVDIRYESPSLSYRETYRTDPVYNTSR
ncbi:DUF7261 family protein [Haloarchaeobius sp. DYHT-AS-18]|uniref:DUF7261 family protein n=1 Tax=Haloarchaeobius sp. DYHT-AS-18 TaxID=3446117 RepID=UPI003EB86EB3